MTSLQHNVRLSKGASTLSKWYVGGNRNGTASGLCGRNAARYCKRHASRSQLLLVNFKETPVASGLHQAIIIHCLQVIVWVSVDHSSVSWSSYNCIIVPFYMVLLFFQNKFIVVKYKSSAMTKKAAAARSTSSPANTEQQALHGPMLCTDRAQPNEAPHSQLMFVRAFPIVDRRLAQASKCQWQPTGSPRRATTCHSLNVDGP
jgi:hypothetical protein